MARILVMADSTCDIPADWVQRYDVRLVPTFVHFGTESLADDGVELTRSDFYARLKSDSRHPTTSTPPLGKTITVMQHALEDADHVIALTAPAKLSGIYNIFRLAAEQFDPDRVTLIDSQYLSMGIGWQIKTALEMIDAGHTPDTIRDALLAMQPRIDIWAALASMEHLKRSGRVGWAAATMGDLLQIKPIVRMKMTEVTSARRVRTSQRAFTALTELARAAAPLERIAFLHTRNLPGVEKLAASLADLNPDPDPVIVDVTPVIGVHVGPNGLGLAVVRASLPTG